jgi:hypothetical protein
MKNKPTWKFWIAWFVIYSVLDFLGEALLNGHPAWSQLPGAIEGALLGATVTWFFGLFFWYKAQDRF